MSRWKFSFIIVLAFFAFALKLFGDSDKSQNQKNPNSSNRPPCSISLISSMDWSRDGERLAVASQYGGIIHVIDVKSGAVIRVFDNNGNSINRVSFGPDGNSIVASGGCGPNDSSGCSPEQLKVWDVKTGKILVAFGDIEAEDGGLCYFSLSPDGKLIAYSDGGKERTFVRRLKDKKIIHEIPCDNIVIRFRF